MNERYVDKKLVYALLNDLVNQCSDKDELFDRAFDGVEALPEIAVASSKTAKEEISDIITDLTRFDDLGNCLHLDEDEIAEAILAAGHRRVVLCKECVYWQDRNSKGTQGICLCGEKEMNYGGEFYPFADDFCSYGERKS